MKKILLFTLLSCITITLNSSCTKEKIYSCDKEVNEWTKSNLETIRQMDREEWSELEYSYQQAAFRAFLASQRIALWKGKIEEALLLDWSDAEKSHILSLLKAIEDNPVWFSDTFKDNETEQDNLALTMFRWREYASDTLKWDKELIYGFIGMPQKLLNKKGDLYKTPIIKRGPIGPPGQVDKCTCNLRSDYCFGTLHCSRPPDCIDTDGGCGTLWVDYCNGVCI